MTTRRVLAVAGVAAMALLLLAPLTAALAAEAEPPVATTAWYWEDQSSQKITDPTSGADLATVEAPNPFCPSTSAGGTPEEAGLCKEGRLPVEVQGSDYETPNKISAVSFDLSLVPIGSQVKKMTAVFLEASDDQSAPLNAAGQSVQACEIEQFFGGGDAREYREAPRHGCTQTDPIAERKAITIKNADGEEVERFQYTFDLTQFATRWVEEGTLQAGIMLYPVQPKEADFDPSTDSNWRVVLAGPAQKNGVKTNIVYKPAALDDLGGLGDLDDFGTDTGSTFGSTGESSFGGTGSDFGSDTGTTGTTPAAGVGEEGAPEELPFAGEETSDTQVESLPGYVYLAVLAGLVAFSLVRQVVLESVRGIRPDGVLAQIRRLNVERRGVAAEDLVAASPSRLDPVVQGLKNLGGRASGLMSKLPFRKRG